MSGSVRSVACGSRIRALRAGWLRAIISRASAKQEWNAEVFRHRVQQRAEAQLPAPVAHAVDDLAARRDHDLAGVSGLRSENSAAA